MNPPAVDRHEADTLRFGRLRNVVDDDTRRPVARGGAACVSGTDRVAELAFVVGSLVGKFGGGKHVLGVDDQKQIVMGLQMDIPGIRRRGDVVHRARIFGVAHVNDRKPLREHVADIGVAAMHHDLHAVGAAALIAVTDQPHVARVIRPRQLAHL